MIDIRDISKTYLSGRGKTFALQNIAFSVPTGRSVILAGRSGSGKTTLLNCLGTLELPDSGRILYEGLDICAMSPRRRTEFRRRQVGFVFQASNLLPWLTVAENLQFPLELNGIGGKEQRHRIDELLAIFGLAGYQTALPAELSGGEAQRIAFARAIAHRPALLLADEPTASLDTENGRHLIDLMLSLCAAGTTTLVLATHDPELLALSQLVIHLKDGKIEYP